MARHRWTLALILICLPILATVITAFRVRDLPKSEDSFRLDRKQKCDDCDVKFGQKVHSVKIENDKHVYEDLKKAVREKQQQLHQKSDSKSAHKFDVSDEEDLDSGVFKPQIGIKHDQPSTKLKSEASNKKFLSSSHEDDDDDDDDDDSDKTSVLKKTKILDIKKPEKPKQDVKSSKIKDSFLKKKDDDDDNDKKALPLKSKPIEIKKVDHKLKQSELKDKIFKPLPKKDMDPHDDDDDDNNDKKISVGKSKIFDAMKTDHTTTDKTSSESSASKEVGVDDNDDDDDDDDDDDEDDDNDDDDGVLSSLWETFSMLGLEIDPSLKPAEKKEKQAIPKEKAKKVVHHNKEDTEQKHKIHIEVIPKVKDFLKKDDVKPDIPKFKESVIKQPSKKSAEKDDERSDDDDDNDDENDDDEIELIKIKPKVMVKEKDNIRPIPKKIIKVGDVSHDDDDDDDDDNDDDDDDSDDDDDDDDDEDNDKPLLIKKMKAKSALKERETEPTVRKPTKISKTSENNDDDKSSKLAKIKPKPAIDEKSILDTEKKIVNIPKGNNIDDNDDDDDDDDDDDEDDDDDDDDDDDEDDHKLKLKTFVKGKDISIANKLPSPQKKEKNEVTKKDDENKQDKTLEKKGEIKSKPESKKEDTIKKGKESKSKEDDHKTEKHAIKEKIPKEDDKPVSKTEEKKDQKEPKTSDDKLRKENVKKDLEKEVPKSKPKEKEEKVEKKTPTSSEQYDDAKEGLNMQEIKKEIKAQIRSSREDKKSDKTSKESKEKLHSSQEISSSTESHLKHVTDALHRRNLLKSEFEDFYAFFPTFAPNFSRIHNPECRRHGQIVLRQLRGTKLWALNMLDATAKIPSGILQGNGIQLGDFDQCVGSRARVQLESGSVVKVQGKYCLARLDVKAEHPELETPVHLAQAKNLIRSRIDDPGHFVPRFSTLSWGVCIPAVCNPEDVEVVIKDAIKHYQKTSGVIVRVKVDEQDCHVEEAEWWKDWIELPTVLTLSFYGVILLLVLVATLQDFFARRSDAEGEEGNEKTESNEEEDKDKEDGNGKQSDGFLSSFSLYHTIDKLVAPGTTDEIACIHGIRGIATLALLFAHKFLPVAVMPYTNRLRITELASSPLWSWCRAGWMFTDCFLLLSGALTAHRISDTDNGAPRRLFSRYLRLTPALLAVVLFYAFVWDNLSTGPMWGTFVTKNAEVCQDGWWWNLLYIQNYFGFEDMCAPQTHQLALDMQLTIIGGILVWLMQVKPGAYKLLLPSLHIAAAYSRYTTVRDHRLTMLAYHGVSVSQLYRTARLSYTSVLHRSTPYLIGLSLGLALKNPSHHGKFILGLGWLSSTALWCLVWWAGADSGSIQYRYNVTFAAQYAALAPIAAALAAAWVIYAVHSGASGFLSDFLCCRPLVLISRLSYALYLTQFVVFITNVATVKSSSEFTLMSLIDVQEISAIILSSVLLTLTFVIPMQNLHKIFTFSSKSESTEESQESGDAEPEKEEKEENSVQKEEKVETPPLKSRQHLIAHREVLEEIPETEVEYESQRDNEGLGEILEEEEDEIGEESVGNLDDDLEIIEEEQGGEDEEDESWMNRRRQYTPRRTYSNEEEQDLDEWEWTANGNRNGAQLYRYSR